VAATICPRPSPLPWAPTSRQQHSSSFPRPTRSHAHRCSRLTRQYGGEQSDLVTLTFDLLTLKVVSVTWATPVPILVFIGLSVLDLGPMYATDVRQTDVRQHHCRQASNTVFTTATRLRCERRAIYMRPYDFRHHHHHFYLLKLCHNAQETVQYTVCEQDIPGSYPSTDSILIVTPNKHGCSTTLKTKRH